VWKAIPNPIPMHLKTVPKRLSLRVVMIVAVIEAEEMVAEIADVTTVSVIN
jgi:hypothetical protein